MFFVDFLALKENVAFIRENIQKCSNMERLKNVQI